MCRIVMSTRAIPSACSAPARASWTQAVPAILLRRSILGVALLAHVGTAQGTAVRLSGNPACSSCSIALEPEVVLQAPDTADAIRLHPAIARASSGTYALANLQSSRIQLYAATGAFIRGFGTKGRGPGEFDRIARLEFGPGDSLYVFEYDRVHVLSPTFVHVRTTLMPGAPRNAVIESDGAMIVALEIRTAEAAGYHAHLLGSDGRRIRSFGAEGEARSIPGCSSCVQELGERWSDGRFTTFARNSYTWRVWHRDGTAGPHYSVSGSPWFRPWTEEGNWLARRAPRPSSLSQIVTSPDGQVWVIGLSSPPGWKPIPIDIDSTGVRILAGNRVQFASMAALEDYVVARERVDFVTIIDRIDLQRGVVIASATVPGLVRLLSWRYAVVSRRLATGEFTVHVLKLKATDPPPVSGPLKMNSVPR